MATQVQFRRGNTAQNDAFTGATGEITVNTSNNSIRVHDDGQQGGYELLRADLTNLSVPLPAGQPAGNTTEVQFNVAGAFTAQAGFTFDPAANLLSAPNLAITETVQSNLNPNLDLTYSLGNLTNRWSELFVGNVTANAVVTETFEATGNATFNGDMFVAGNMLVAGSTFGGDDSTVTGNLAVTGNITAPFANIDVANIGTLNVDNLVIANLAATALLNGNSNVVVVPNAEVTISSNGIANIIRVDETGTRFERTSNFAGNVVLSQHTEVSALANLHIPGGLPGQAITTDGLGNLVWANAGGGGGISGGFANGMTEGMIPVADGNINFMVGGTPDIVVFTNKGANFNGETDFAGNVTAVDIAATGNINAFSFTAESKITTVDFAANGNVSLGNVADVEILGGTTGQVLQTDGAGNLFWVDLPSSTGFANGTSGANIPVADGNINFTVGGIANTLVLSPVLTKINTDTDIYGTANIAGEILGAGNANIALNIAAGGNITSGGNGTFVGTVTAGNLTTAGDVTARNGIYSGNVAVAANLSALNGTFTNNVTAVNTTLSGNLKANTGNIVADLRVGGNTTTIGTSFSAAANVTGNVTSGNVVTGIVTANTANFAGNIVAANANLGNLATANFFSGDGSLLANVIPAGQFSMNFSYTNVSPLNLAIVPTGKTLVSATVVVVTPFNDVAAKLSLGTVANANSVLATTDILAQVNGTYTAQPAVRYGANTQLVLGIIPGTSTQGDGVLTINYI